MSLATPSYIYFIYINPKNLNAPGCFDVDVTNVLSDKGKHM